LPLSLLNLKTLALSAIVASCGVLALLFPPLQDIAENADLSWLFGARGARAAPSDVVVVSIDKESAQALGLPHEPHRWPRRLHAQLVDRLRAAGAAVIGFDVMFKQPQAPQDDELLADAIARAGNVLLFAYLDVRKVGAEARVEHVVMPLPRLLAGARGAAIFPLPKFPKRVNQVWTFKPGAGSIPTFPAVMAQLAAPDDYAALRALPPLSDSSLPPTLRDAAREPGIAATMTQARSLLRRGPEPAEATPGVRALHALYSAPDSVYLNYYGPARSIPTVPFARALTDAPRELFANKAVFVGLSEPLQTDQIDIFHTVFSQPDGVDLSGVEISATAYANLRAGDWIRPFTLGAALVLAVFWAVATTAACRALPTPAAVGGTLALGAGYFGAALFAFAQFNVWLPLFVPLAVQAPVALFVVTLSRFLEESREKRKVRDALQRYLPAAVIDEIADDIARGRRTQHLVYGACVATDAEHYTMLSEKMSPQVLSQFMNRYYSALFPPVMRNGGFVSDVIGDAMMAIWTSLNAPNVKRRQSACVAALEMRRAVDEFNRNQPLPLPTRIGVHAGEMALGNIGADAHYEYRAVGDMVNTAARVQGLNKILGTRLLATGDAVRGVEGIALRRLGAFRLSGKTQPVEIVELLGGAESIDAATRECIACFERAHALFERREWDAAEDEFAKCRAPSCADGPVEFFAAQCRRMRASPPDDSWDGVIDVDAK
jgi:adenylate cyclase